MVCYFHLFRDLVVNFVNVDVQISATESHAERSLTTSDEVTPLSPARSTVLSPATTGTPSPVTKRTPLKAVKATPKINVTKRNNYGETQLHLACKKGNLTRIAECLRQVGYLANSFFMYR